MKNDLLADKIQKMIDNIDYVQGMAGLLVKDNVKKDFENAAKESVDRYYEYKKGSYTQHGRKHRLYGVYNVTTTIRNKNGSVIITPRIEMDSDRLEGLYHTNSTRHDGNAPWDDGGDVDASYVFENFIKGLHPWTNGWPSSGYENLEYKRIKQKGQTPNAFLNSYIDNYNKKFFSKYVQEIMNKLL